MPRAKRVTPGAYVYHVLNRGVGRRRLFDKPQDFEAFQEAAKNSRDLLAITFSDSALILCKSYIERPVQLVFDSPVSPDEPRQHLHLGRQATDDVRGFFAYVPVDAAIAVDHRYGTS